MLGANRGIRVVGLSVWLDPPVRRKVLGGVLSAGLHILLLIAIVSGGRYVGMNAGEATTSQLMLLEAPEDVTKDGTEMRRQAPAIPEALPLEQVEEALANLPPPPPSGAMDPQPPQLNTTIEPLPEATESSAPRAITIPSTFAMSLTEKAAMAQKLERLVAESLTESRAEVAWELDGKQYSAVLVREQASDGTALERVVAEVTASDRGKQLTTLVNLKRLAFSQFTQMIDRWDPMVQIHDDEIVGRFHTNSRFKLLHDSSATPKFLGKVTTAARSINVESRTRRRDADIFRGGIEMHASHIHLPESLQPFQWAPREQTARVHELASDTRIRFYADGTYTLSARRSSEAAERGEPSAHPVYFVGGSKATLYVQGVVAGKVLVYSPERIVIEDSITYARDPREAPDSRDFLGLVSDRLVVVAPPSITGPGDLEIDAAVFAGRRFLVTNIDHPREATLRIYGSLAAGTISATEPRYATRIEYDNRFEHQRPPGFPSTNRYEVADWDGRWTEMPERAAEN
jgi:hypothetical protein